MDYTTSDAFIAHASGRRLHQSHLPVPTEVSQRDMNMVIWSLMEVVNEAGLPATDFDPNDQDTFRQLLKALLKLLSPAYGSIKTPMQYGARGDGSDDTMAVCAALADLRSGDILDLLGRSYKVHGGVAGVSSGDAVPLDRVPRLAGKTNITVRNGKLYAADPSTAPSKLRFPSVLALDGCTNIRFQAVVLVGKGESWGNSDASQPLGYSARRPFLAQNGGHPCVGIRSRGIWFDKDCRFEKTGSVGAFYSASCDEVHIAGYASAESLGYAAFAADSWCGGASDSGFPQHRLYLWGARSDNNGADYGSKGCVVAEDRDVVVYVQGGIWKDAYANGAAPMLGAAFTANGAKVYVKSVDVENCAAVGMTTNNINDDTVLEVIGLRARGLRTTMHIFDRTSYGAHRVKYDDYDVEVVGTSLWPQTELSIPTVIANRKVTSVAEIELGRGRTRGARTFAINERACYGGMKLMGGDHWVTDRILDSNGWGGASAGSQKGYEAYGAAKFHITGTGAPSASLTQPSKSDILVLQNKDGQDITTYQYLDFDRTVTVEAQEMRSFISITLHGGTEQLEKRILAQKLLKCAQSVPAGESYVGQVRVVSLDGTTGPAVRVTLAMLSGKFGRGRLTDDTFAVRELQSEFSGPVIVGGELHYGVFINGGAYNLTVGGKYQVQFNP